MNVRKSLAILSLVLGTAFSSVAQDYYDDDIYYNPEKAKKEQAEKAKKAAEAKRKANQPLPGSDQYVVYTDNTRNVDEYNRRYVNREVVDTTLNENGDFVYTRRIERFYNPEIVSGSGNEDLQYNYYEAQAEKESSPTYVNVYVNDPWYSNSWRYPYYYTSWGWDPYYWGPGWYGPSWSWSWNWGPSWGWGPSWAWNWGPGWGYLVGGWHPAPPYRPSVGGMITHRPNHGNNYNYGYAPTYGGRRPGNMGNGNYQNNTNGNYNNSGNHNNNYNGTGTTGGRRPGANRESNSNNNNSNRHTYNRDYNNSNNNSGSSFGSSGGRRGGSGSGFGGGSTGGHRGGAGSGGGRRR